MRFHRFRRCSRGFAALLTVAASIVSPPPLLAAAAQDPSPLPARPIVIDAAFLLVPVRPELTEASRHEVEAWQREYLAWRKWAAEWRNRTEPGWFSRRDRRPKPDPPAWLIDACSKTLDDVWLAEQCALVTDWQSDFVTAQFRDSQTNARAQHEKPTKTLWWEHIHLDALWPITQSRGTAFGLFGTHLTIDVTGRLEVFGAPGFIMLTMPTATGRDWAPATDWGIAYRLGTFPLPGSTGRATLHLNLARAWVLGAAGAVFSRTVDLVGLSLTFPNTKVPPP
jgi:hypothetical protein